MIEIKEEHYITKGNLQKCYIHPENDDLCIKIRLNEQEIDPHYNTVRYNNRFNDEIKYYKKVQKKNLNKFEYSFFSNFYGIKKTNLGNGYIFDLIKDEKTNKISLTLCDYLKMDKSPFSDDLLISKLKKLKNLMIEHKIIVSDLTSENICCKILKDNSLQLIVVDGLGHRDFIPSVDYIRYFTKRKVEKIYQRQRLYNMNVLREYLKKRKLW